MGHDERHRERQAFLDQVDDDVLDRQPRGPLYAIDQIPAQPARLSGGVGGDDHLSGAAPGDRIHRRQEWVVRRRLRRWRLFPLSPAATSRSRHELCAASRTASSWMTSPAVGFVWGTTRRNCHIAFRRTCTRTSSSFSPPSVRLATTKYLFHRIVCSFTRGCVENSARSTGGATDSRRARGWSEGAVYRAWHAVLVRPADDGRDAVEVEDRRRRGNLPLESSSRATGWRRRVGRHASW